MKFFKVAVFLAALTALTTAPVSAAIIITKEAGGTGNNLLFQCPTLDAACIADLGDNDDTIIGTFNDGVLQALLDANVNIKPGAGGQAVVEKVSATDNWTRLDVSWLHFDSTDEVIVKVRPTSDTNAFTLFARDFGGTTYSQSFTGVAHPGGDFFTFQTDDPTNPNKLIAAWWVVATTGSLSEVLQVRIGDAYEGDDIIVTPEPATLALFGMGLLVAGARARRRR